MTLTHALTHVFGKIHTALFPIIRTEFNLSLQQLGLIAALPPLCQALLAVPTGLLSDRFGSRRMIAVSFIVAIAGAILVSQTTGPLMLSLAISLVYANTAIYHPASYSFTTRMFSPSQRPKALGIHGAGGTFGLALGPISVSILTGLLALGWRQVYLFWAGPLLLGILVVWRIKSEPKEDAGEEAPAANPQGRGESLFTLGLAAFLSFAAVRMMAGQMIDVFLPIYLVEQRGVSSAMASLIYGSSSVVGLVAAPLGGLLASRFGEKRWLLASLFMSYLSLTLALLVPGVAAFAALYLLSGFCNTLGMAANSSIMAGLSPSRRRGLGFSLFFLPGELTGVAGPVVAAAVAEAFGFNTLFASALLVYALSLFVFHLGVKVQPRRSV